MTIKSKVKYQKGGHHIENFIFSIIKNLTQFKKIMLSDFPDMDKKNFTF